MAFASTITGYAKMANKNVVYGSWTTDTTGGDINTGLRQVDFMFLTPTGSSVSADAPTVDESLPVAGSAVTIVVTSTIPGYWMAIGD